MLQIVEKNPTKFRIDGAELAVRKGFIDSTREEVKIMKDRISNPGKAQSERISSQVNNTFPFLSLYNTHSPLKIMNKRCLITVSCKTTFSKIK